MRMSLVNRMVIDAAMEVHKRLGPGSLKSAYEASLVDELEKRGLSVHSKLPLPFYCDGLLIDPGYRVDLLINDTVIVELRSAKRSEQLHKAQLLSYLRLSNLKLGLLINFNEVHLQDGISRIINGL